MRLKLAIVFIVLLSLFCEEENSDKTNVDKLKSSNSLSIDESNNVSKTITDEVTITILTDKEYNKDSVSVKVKFENMMAKRYLVCQNMKLNFPLYPIITPTVEIINVTDSMDYLFDTLGPGESIIKNFNFSRYCKFKAGVYDVQFLYTQNAPEYKTEKLKGLKLKSFSINVK